MTDKYIQMGGELIKAVDNGDGTFSMSSASFRSVKTAVIATGGTVSAALDCGQTGCLTAISLGAEFDGTTLSFQTSNDGTTYQVLNDEYGNAVSMTVAASKNYNLNLNAFYPWRYVKFVAGEQTGATTITAIIRGL